MTAPNVIIAGAGLGGLCRAQGARRQPVAPWETRPVTLLGDAIHAMSPARGSDANIALKDAGRLCDAIITATANGIPHRDAVAGYEREMLQYGFAAVSDSLAVARQGNGPLARVLRLLRRNRE